MNILCLILINLITFANAYNKNEEDCGDRCIATIIGICVIFLMCCICCLRGGSEEDDENQGDSDIV